MNGEMKRNGEEEELGKREDEFGVHGAARGTKG